MPFLQADMDNQIEQRFLRFLSRRYRTMSAFAGALCLLPEKARLAFVRWWTSEQPAHTHTHTHTHTNTHTRTDTNTQTHTHTHTHTLHLLASLNNSHLVHT